jgi:hypothetical protein
MKTNLKIRKRIVLAESQFKRLIDAISNGTTINEEVSDIKSNKLQSAPKFL